MPHSTTTTTTTNTSTSPLKASFDSTGYIILPSNLTASQLTSLRSACQTATALARSSQWPHIRTLPRQFPPWPSTPSDEGIWGVQHLMHPSLPGSALLTGTYFSSGIISVVRELLECDDDELVMELWNLLVRPDRDFELRWHRDDVAAAATDAEQMERLGRPAFHAQWNLALYDDESLIVVPGSHLRPLTATERNADPYEREVPEMEVVKLKAGEMVFYNNNILHRGVYRADVERMTLHGSMGHVDGGPLRARNVLQHGREWIEGVDFSQVENKERAEGMRARLLELGRRHKETGFAHDE